MRGVGSLVLVIMVLCILQMQAIPLCFDGLLWPGRGDFSASGLPTFKKIALTSALDCTLMPLHLLIYLISCSTVSTFFHDLICLAARLIQKMALHNRRCQTDRRVEHHESSGRESLCFQESWFFCRPQAAHFVEDFKLTTPGAEWAAYPPNLWQVDLGVTILSGKPMSLFQN